MQTTAKELGPKWQEAISTIGLFASALLVTLFVINFVFRSYEVAGLSMSNTLHNGDRMLVWKGGRSLARLTGNDYIPDRGNIIIFTEPDLSACGQTEPKELVKRVIGLPGEHIVLAGGKYTVYNATHPDGFNPDAEDGYAPQGIGPTSGSVDVTLKADQLFVSGDNRPNSCDSRAFGAIDAGQVIGRVQARLAPVSDIKIL